MILIIKIFIYFNAVVYSKIILFCLLHEKLWVRYQYFFTGHVRDMSYRTFNRIGPVLWQIFSFTFVFILCALMVTRQCRNQLTCVNSNIFFINKNTKSATKLLSFLFNSFITIIVFRDSRELIPVILTWKHVMLVRI